MRVLIAGASGLLGTTLAPVLVEAGHEIIRHCYRHSGDVACDLTNRQATQAMLNAVRPQVIVNLVACTDVDQCERDPHGAYLLNVRTVENLVAGMNDKHKAFLIHISTDQVYDAAGPSREDDIRLTNTYALTKYAGELATQGLPTAVLRTNFFGHSHLPGRRSFSDWVLDNLRNAVPTVAFADIMVTLLAMPTLCRMIARVIENPVVGTFNLGSHGAMSKADFIFEVARVYGLPTDAVRRGAASDAILPTYRPKDMSMDSHRFEAIFDVTLPRFKDEIVSLKGSECAII